MTHILQINSSLFGADGQSTKLADALVGRYRREKPETTVTVRDLTAEPVPHLDAVTFTAFATPAPDRSAAQRDALALSDQLVAELQAADVIILALPMYNFQLPSPLKAWIDHVARAGVTFRYTENGPQGLLTGRRAYVTAARGGHYLDSGNDHQTPYIRQFLNFLGIDPVEFIHAEGLAMTGEADKPMERAHAAIEAIMPATARTGDRLHD
ncbi:MAG: NAD(P)H-dependent oxidoreductase [Wenzhouxiangellaceae bacterium]|nr:NAD(P)H-dependent oxidoreductase [Wenzhouxiangellaceae bacterium]